MVRLTGILECTDAYTELRHRFDQGDDPNDPSGGHGGMHHQNPFAHHGGSFQQFFQQGGQRQYQQKAHFQWG